MGETLANKRKRIRSVIAAGGPQIVYQPLFLLSDMRLAGVEALSRFPTSDRTVENWFEDALASGLRTELELSAIARAIDGFREVWETRSVRLGLNASAATILDERLDALLQSCPRDRIVIEITEHEPVKDYPALRAAMVHLRALGVWFAIDDVGAGYAGLAHILELRPEIVKLDRKLISGINDDPVKATLMRAIKVFAESFGSRTAAEGVETEAELQVLTAIGVLSAQGYLLGRPSSLDSLASCEAWAKARAPQREMQFLRA